jgi:Flp pilus assembly protein TadG
MSIYRNRKRGFTLLAAGMCAVALCGAAGLAVDIGRVYITKNEAQGYVDAAAVSAAMKLDGTASGLTAADSAVTASTNKWNFATANFAGTVVEYSPDGLNNWATSGSAPPATSRYARVTATVNNVALFLLPVIGAFGGNIGTSTTVKASAVAGQVIESATVFPYSPVAHALNCPPGAGLPTMGVACDATGNYGYQFGQRYDLKWPTNPTKNAPCDGDNAPPWINMVDGFGAPQELGPIAFNGTSDIVAQIQDDVRPYNPELKIGDYLNPPPGDRNSIVKPFNDRAALDNLTDVVYQANLTDINGDGKVDLKDNTTYATYLNAANHTGRRLITVIVRSGYNFPDGSGALPVAQQSMAVGFAQFLLLPAYAQSGGGNNAWCATYVGNSSLTGTGQSGVGTGGLGVAYVRLTQ